MHFPPPLPRQTPRLIAFGLAFLFAVLTLGVLARGGFYWAFSAAASDLPASAVFNAFVLGLRYDLRFALWALLPVLLLGGWTRLSPCVPHLRGLRRLWAVSFTLAGGWCLFQIFDFAHYAYLGVKLAASILNFLEDPKESAGMVWQTYPVLRLTAGWLLVSTALGLGCLRLLRWSATLPGWSGNKLKTTGLAVVLGLLTILGIHGKFSQYPLRWSDAYVVTHPFAPALALNPVLNFWDTRNYVGASYDMAKVRAAYPRMAAMLGVDAPDVAKLDYGRVLQPRPDALPGKPNVVLVLMESFSAYKSSVSGNVLDTTPHLKAIAAQGLHFDRFFTSHTGTARGVFATLTGLPDVDVRNTSSRNPAAVDQHSIANVFADYDKHYFIGGSTTWANVRGVINKTMSGVQLHEEGSFKSPVVDVWGISDKSLFLEANEVFRAAQRPFFAVIQTSGNHRPYTIPPQDTDFEVKDPGLDKVKENGFFSVEEYNAFRYMDYAVGKFFETARKEAYFDNTVFVFLGDHGIAVQGHGIGPHMPRAWQDLGLSAVHTPFIVYAPKLIRQAQRLSTPGMQIDVMPTIAGFMRRPYRAQALGRDLRDPRYDSSRVVFTIAHEGQGFIGLLQGRWYYLKRATEAKGKLHAVDTPDPGEDWSAREAQKADELNRWLDDYFVTAQYLLTHNHAKPHP